jgi:glycosyltransferase involved in cell wall biosynthesis
MWKYWSMLDSVRLAQDFYQPDCVYGEPGKVQLFRGSKWQRGFTRKVSSPLAVRSRVRGGLAHILDHSWSDLTDFLPKSVQSVVTVHDLIPLRYAGELGSREVGRFKDRVSKLRSVDAIISVSKYTKNEIVERLGISEDRIYVVPNGVNLPPLNGVRGSRKPVDQLRVGSLGSVLMRKNLEVLAPAFKMYKEDSKRGVKLIRAGLPLSVPLKSALLNVLGEDGLEEWGRVSEEKLEDFYQSIDVMVIPSLYEGFGLPVLEAMARGIPVISSDATSLPEVGADAALYFDPLSPESLSECLLKLEDVDLYEKLRCDGLLRSQQFSWRRTLEGIYTVYDEVLAL